MDTSRRQEDSRSRLGRRQSGGQTAPGQSSEGGEAVPCRYGGGIVWENGHGLLRSACWSCCARWWR